MQITVTSCFFYTTIKYSCLAKKATLVHVVSLVSFFLARDSKLEDKHIPKTVQEHFHTKLPYTFVNKNAENVVKRSEKTKSTALGRKWQSASVPVQSSNHIKLCVWPQYS